MPKKDETQIVQADKNGGVDLMEHFVDSTGFQLDLTKAEKIRTTALILACNYVRDTICSDAQMYQALKADSKQLVPATMPYVIQGAVQFEMFLLGEYSGKREEDAPEAAPAPALAGK